MGWVEHDGTWGVIEVEDLSFRYPGAEREAIRGLSMRVRRGSLFGLLGPNGSGKTTLISILTGLLPADSGRACIDSRILPAQTREVQALSALVPQDYAFYAHLSVMENLRFFAGVLGIQAVETRGRLDEALAVTGLESFTAVRAAHLSGGLKRRLNLAIGLLGRPQLVFLDEPTVGIDTQSRHFILEAIKRVNANGVTVVYTSHYMEEVEMLCDEIGVLDDGRLLACGTLQHLLNGAAGHTLRVVFSETPSAQQRAALDIVAGLDFHDKELRLKNCSESDLNRLMGSFADQRMGIARMQYGYGNLEELFLHLTGRQLRD